jgi:endonuclease/exonuclease/phosphatase family metal-dependent hydrolase
MNIKLLQWNTWYKEDIKNKTSFLKEVDADIYCLQELNEKDNEFQRIKSELGLEGYLGTTETIHGTQGNAILSKYPILHSKNSYIKDPKEFSSNFSDEARKYIETTLDINGKELTVGTTHMSYTKAFKENDLRREESHKLLEQISKHKSSYLFSGDLNLIENSELVKTLEKKLKHAGPNYSEKTWATKEFDYGNFKVNSLDYRLDYVFTTNDIKVVNTKIVKTDYSDHLPILTEIKI